VSGGLLVVTAHPDDEVLIAGGALAACADLGAPSAVVCLTRGEHGPISDPALTTREKLGATRARELEAACAVLAVDWVKGYRREDGSLRWSDRSAIVTQLTRVVRARRPSAVVTFGEDGLYYHPDHIATFEFTRRAVARAEVGAALYRAVWPQTLMSELVAELRARSLPEGLWEMDAEDFGVEDEDRDGEVVLDVRRFVERKLCALRCHRTQLGPSNAFSALPADLAERFLGYERFVQVPLGPSPAPDWLVEALGARVAAYA
jgi:N-acetyl-1-D-myo-inositol-2-amino-2-deoxy-alpha-D-glucopyranoside deacetylase